MYVCKISLQKASLLSLLITLWPNKCLWNTFSPYQDALKLKCACASVKRSLHQWIKVVSLTTLVLEHNYCCCWRADHVHRLRCTVRLKSGVTLVYEGHAGKCCSGYVLRRSSLLRISKEDHFKRIERVEQMLLICCIHRGIFPFHSWHKIVHKILYGSSHFQSSSNKINKIF